jgi:hypothetical protein
LNNLLNAPTNDQAGAGDGLCALLLGEADPPAPADSGSMDLDPPQQQDATPPPPEPSAAVAAAAAVAAVAAPRDPALARAVCEEALARDPLGAGWARGRLARLQLEGRECEGAVASFQAAIRRAPLDAGLWEGLGAAYQVGGSLTSAV